MESHDILGSFYTHVALIQDGHHSRESMVGAIVHVLTISFVLISIAVHGAAIQDGHLCNDIYMYITEQSPSIKISMIG